MLFKKDVIHSKHGKSMTILKIPSQTFSFLDVHIENSNTLKPDTEFIPIMNEKLLPIVVINTKKKVCIKSDISLIKGNSYFVSVKLKDSFSKGSNLL